MILDAYIAGVGRLIELFNIAGKKPAKKYCRDLVITSKDLYHIILAGRAGTLEPYRYACHFDDIVPAHLPPNARDKEALDVNGVGSLSPSAAKAVCKIKQIFKERRMFAAHLFFTPSCDYWHLLYFDQRDTNANDNHWAVGGSHIHYSRESFSRDPLPVIWQAICERPPKPPRSTHVRYEDLHEEG